MTKLKIRDGKIEKLTPKQLENYERKIFTGLLEEPKNRRHVDWLAGAHYAGSALDSASKRVHKLAGLALGVYHRWF